MSTTQKDNGRFRIWIVLFVLMGLLVAPQIAFGALTATVTGESTVQLNWAGTGTGPYTLYRNGVQIYSGSATSYQDTRLGYSTGYDYTLHYRNYEKVSGGYYSTSTYWGIVREAYTYTSEEYRLIEPGHYVYEPVSVPWCIGTINGVTYSHAPPCEYSSNATTIIEYRPVWIPDRYGWVTVTHYVPEEYGWVTYTYWVSEVWDYVARTTTATSGPVQGTKPSVTILSPTYSQWAAHSIIPRVSVSDLDGEPLSVSYTINAETTARETKNISNTSTAQEVAFSQLNLSGLAEGQHTLKASVTDHHYEPVVATVSFNIDRTAPAIGTTQISVTDSQITATGSAVDSGVGLSTAPYRYQIGTTQSGWVAGTYTFNGLSPDTAYNLIVEARDKLDLVSSHQQTVYTMAQRPTINIVQSAETSLQIRAVDSNPSHTRYQIKVGSLFVDAAGHLTPTPINLSLTDKQLTVKGLQPGTTYSIQAAAVNQPGQLTAWSNATTGVTLAAPPDDIDITRTQNSISLTWSPEFTATRYDIEVDGSIVANGTATNYTHSGLMADTSHIYRVRVVNAGGVGRWSAERVVSTLPNPPDTPTGLEDADHKQTYVTLSWNAAPRATSYEVEADGAIVNVGNTTTYTHSGLFPESTHSYRVRAINIGGISGWSTPISVVTWPDPPSTPENVVADPSIYQIDLNWEAAERATYYEIEADGLIFDVGNQLSFTHEALLPLTVHTYRVRGVNIGGKSAWSAPVVMKTHPEIPEPPTNLMATSNEEMIMLTWYEVPHTDYYEIEINGTTTVSATANLFEEIGLSHDSRHVYRVRAINISGASEWSQPITIGTLPANETSSQSLTNVAAIVTPRFITITWDSVAPDAQYDIEVDGMLKDNGNDTVFHHTGLSANELHHYRIRVKDQDQVGDWVAILSLSTLSDLPDAPVGLEAYPSAHSIELHWALVDGATGYDLEIDGQTIELGAESTYLHEQLEPGTAYTYRIRAKNETGFTAWSPVIVKSTTRPSYTVNGIEGETFVLSLFAFNVQDFSEMTYVVTYNPNEMEVVDLYQYTPDQDIDSGRIPSSPLDVVYEPGKITIRVDRNVVPGTSWSGEITAIEFKANVTGQITLEANLE